MNQTWGGEDRPIEELLTPYPDLDTRVKAHLATGDGCSNYRSLSD
jgi:salicylate hydroxylase